MHRSRTGTWSRRRGWWRSAGTRRPCDGSMAGVERIEVELFCRRGNNAIVRMPGRRFPGVLIQGDSPSNLHREVARVVEACAGGDMNEAHEGSESALADLDALIEDYSGITTSHCRSRSQRSDQLRHRDKNCASASICARWIGRSPQPDPTGRSRATSLTRHSPSKRCTPRSQTAPQARPGRRTLTVRMHIRPSLLQACGCRLFIRAGESTFAHLPAGATAGMFRTCSERSRGQLNMFNTACHRNATESSHVRAELGG